MKIARMMAVGVCTVLLIGCGTRTEDNEEPGAISDYQLKSMEQAQNVEQLLQDADKQRNQE